MLLVRALAKLNLLLCVGALRPDGYHDLQSVFQQVELWDDVLLEDAGPDAPIAVTTSLPEIPCDRRNTAYRAAEMLRDRYAPGRGVRIHLEKRIPAEAGLGGGSSDAAAVLLGLNRLWGLALPHAELEAIAADVGSDVPFFITGGCALVCGRGDRVQALPLGAPGWFLIAKPSSGVSTARAYADLDARRAGHGPAECAPRVQALLDALSRRDVVTVGAALWNDLEPPVLAAHPEIARLKEDMATADAAGALMSGSGSAVFGLFDTEAKARQAASALSERWPWVVVAAPATALEQSPWSEFPPCC